MVALTPFVLGWAISIAGVATPVRVWPGNLIVELTVGTCLALLGTTVAGYWWCEGGGRDFRGGCLAALVLAAWGLAAWLGCLLPWVYWAGTAALLLAGVFSRVRKRRQRQAAEAGPHPGIPWNGVLFALILVLGVASDCMVLGKMEATPSAAAALVMARVLTQGVLVAMAWYWLLLFELWSPLGTRWLVAGLLGLTLAMLAAEIAMNALWGKGLILFFGELVVGGKFDLRRAMEGGGVDISLASALQAGTLALVVTAIYLGSAWLSRRIGLRLRPRTLLLTALGLWLLLFVEQASESLWNGRHSRWLQRRSLLVHLCPNNSKPGWASFTVKFREPAVPAAWSVTRKPDIHLFIVETLRGDAVRPEVMPFLSHWRDTECQQMKSSFAASNATHLSWFALLSGKPAVFWERDRQAQRPAFLLESLRAAGYRNEIRSASILDYAEMDTTNFGHGEATDEMLNTRIDPDAWPAGVGECDLRVFEHWKHSVLANGAGGTFRLLAVESPHFPYRWAKSFTPPRAEYFPSAMLPLHPGGHEIQMVRNRYVNSVAWVDTLLRDYVAFLKQHGRYDDAMIVITGDHGEEMQEYGFWFHASALTQEQTAVPLLIKWPKDCGRGSPVAQASHLDIVPSILDVLGCPRTQLHGMAGRPLRQGGDLTVLVTSHFASHDFEAMLWRRNGYEAAFSWAKIWVPGRPDRLWLERLSGPSGPLRFESPVAAEAALHRYFPDAFERWFTRFEQDDRP